MNNVRTVSDTKRTFYSLHTRPINSIYRRVVEELMVEMHLLSVNVDFRYDPIYGMGVVTSFNRFMQGYRPERDKEPIFDALCQAVGDKTEQYEQDAQRLEELAKRLPGKEIVAWLNPTADTRGASELHDAAVKAIANHTQFKYSRLFAIGLYTLLELADPDLVKDEKQRIEALRHICLGLSLPEDKLLKDLEFYRSNLEKMAQMRLVMEDALVAERKKRERSADKGVVAAPPNSP
ncbi:photosystem II biogenesis protein Psp29 [Trichocoleus sp. FACHB-90]|uniref:photosystem II biogenesis protein Psp29 n=1 Tax=Cyanophyceae TaxID=3028117 RepID=UPI0016839D0E|nr:photosystem II biogenesis protein Psp29 [Trichocoleus sp. FACHB-90]